MTSNLLFIDTETTGKADLQAWPSAEHQPRIVSLAALLTDHTGRDLASFAFIFKTEGVLIPPEASAVHGITNLIADRSGIERRTGLRALALLAKQSSLVIAHNVDFDNFMVEIELARAPEIKMPVLPVLCTMREATPLCKLPGKFDTYKWPKLEEAYRILCGKELVGAHDALTDVRACRDLYFEILKRNQPNRKE